MKFLIRNVESPIILQDVLVYGINHSFLEHNLLIDTAQLLKLKIYHFFLMVFF